METEINEPTNEQIALLADILANDEAETGQPDAYWTEFARTFREDDGTEAYDGDDYSDLAMLASDIIDGKIAPQSPVRQAANVFFAWYTSL